VAVAEAGATRPEMQMELKNGPPFS
jgi:hypothetical protein